MPVKIQIPPAAFHKLTVSPKIINVVTLSFRIIQDPSPTNTGLIFTITTELATEVYLREAIQKVKWRARKRPVGRSNFHRPRRIFPYLLRWRAIGASNGRPIQVGGKR